MNWNVTEIVKVFIKTIWGLIFLIYILHGVDLIIISFRSLHYTVKQSSRLTTNS